MVVEASCVSLLFKKFEFLSSYVEYSYVLSHAVKIVFLYLKNCLQFYMDFSWIYLLF